MRWVTFCRSVLYDYLVSNTPSIGYYIDIKIVNRRKIRFTRNIGIAVLLLVLVTSFHPAAITTATAAPTPAASCSAAQQSATWAADQKTVLARLGSLTTLNNKADVLKLAAKGWSIPSHQYVSFENIGVTFGRPVAVPGPPPEPGFPDLVLYKPNPAAKNVIDPNGADFPYTLVGWAYTQAYNFKQIPTAMGPCYPREVWFAHERGIHDFATWGFIPIPPKENFLGQESGYSMPLPFPPGLPHIRFWDIHIWKDGTAPGVPSISIQRTTALGTIPGINPPGAFFYPPKA